MLIPLGFLSGPGTQYFFSGSTGTTTGAAGIAVTTDDKFYTITGATNQILVGYDKYAETRWQKQVNTGGNFSPGLQIDSSGNVYTLDLSSNAVRVRKWDSSGDLTWQKAVSGEATGWSSSSFAVAPSGNVYVGGSYNTSGLIYKGALVKLNSSGVIQWSRADDSVEVAYRVSLDSSENVYFAGLVQGPGANRVVKYNSSGTLQWIRSVSSPDFITNSAVTADSSGNVYWSHRIETDSTLLQKLDTSGTLVWSRELPITTVPTLKTDSAGNLYVAFTANIVGDNDWVILKFNSSGTVQWQRRIGTSSNEVPETIAFDSLDNPLIGGGLGIPLTRNNVAKVPADGSRTGTYNFLGTDITYASTSLTITTVTQAVSTITPSAVTITPSVSDTSLTVTDSTLATRVIPIGN